MRAIDQDLWVAEQPLRFGGLELGARMTAVRLSDASLMLYSPIALTDALREQVDALGPVGSLVAPNRFHHLFVSDWVEAYPEAALYVPRTLSKKRADLRPAGVLPEDAPEAWSADLQWVLLAGQPMLNEVVFLHRKTRTLLVCDVAFNIGREAPWATRLGFRLWGRKDDFGPTYLERLTIRDRAAARASMEQILAFDFDRVVVSHGQILERGGRDALRRGFQWLVG